MTRHHGFEPFDPIERRFSDALVEFAEPRIPPYMHEVLATTSRTRQRPAWAFLERWLPMAVITRPAAAPPLRAAWLLVLAGLLAATLVGTALLIGSRLVRGDGPNQLRGGALVPTLALESTWDDSTIPGFDPGGIAVGPDGNVYTVDITSSQVLVLDPDGNVVRRWGEPGNGEGQFNFEVHGGTSVWFGSVAVAPDGSVYVADTFNRRIQQFEPDGTFVRAWGGYGPNEGQFLMPFDVSVGADGSVYVVDVQREDIQRFTAEGDFVEVTSGGGASHGVAKDAQGIGVKVDVSRYDIDERNGRINAWVGGVFHSALLADGTGSLSLSAPRMTRWIDVARDASGNIYVAEPDRVLVLSPSGELLSEWPMPHARGSFQVVPIAVAPGGTVYLSAETEVHKLGVSLLERAVTAAAAETIAPAVASGADPSAPVPAATPVVTHRVTVEDRFPLRISFDLPPMWVGPEVNRGRVAVYRNNAGNWPAWVNAHVVENVMKDPCDVAAGTVEPAVGPTVDDLTEALTHLPGYRVASPVADITLDGFEGKTFELETSLDPAECSDPTWLFLWTGYGAAQGPDVIEPYGVLGMAHQRIAILDVDGTRVLLEAHTYLGATREEVIEANQVLESVDFG